MEGQPHKRAKDETLSKLWPTLVTNWKIWPAVQVLNLSVVPTQMQAIVVSAVGFFWNIYLSYMKNN